MSNFNIREPIRKHLERRIAMLEAELDVYHHEDAKQVARDERNRLIREEGYAPVDAEVFALQVRIIRLEELAAQEGIL